MEFVWDLKQGFVEAVKVELSAHQCLLREFSVHCASKTAIVKLVFPEQ